VYGKDGSAEPVPEQPAPSVKASAAWVAPDAGALAELLAKLGARVEHGAKPSADAVCFVAPLGRDATSSALALGVDPARTVAVDPLFGYAKRRTLMTTPVTRAEVRAAAHGLLASDGVPVSVIRDSAGFVAQRVVAHVVNVGCDIVQQRIATPEDLDRAVMLGLGYPKGPLAMGDALGAGRILTVLEAMHEFYKEPRYRPSPWLTRRARLGVSLLTAE
jgi:3-hydroxybutyryl-CoA dehydrogenase